MVLLVPETEPTLSPTTCFLGAQVEWHSSHSRFRARGLPAPPRLTLASAVLASPLPTWHLPGTGQAHLCLRAFSYTVRIPECSWSFPAGLTSCSRPLLAFPAAFGPPALCSAQLPLSTCYSCCGRADRLVICSLSLSL